MRWKWILGLIGLVIAVLILIFYVILVSYDYNKLKPKIAQAVLDATGRELTLRGDIKIGIGFSPSLEIENVSFQNAPWGSRPELAKVKRFEIQMPLLPLIRREFDFKRLILIEPDILLETGPSGELNLEFKPAKKLKPEEKKEGGEKSFPFLIFDEVRIEKGILTYRDSQRAKTYSLRLESLHASLLGGERPTAVSLKGIFNGRPIDIRGTTGPLANLRTPGKPWPIKLAAKFSGATVTVDGSVTDALEARSLDLTLSAQGSSIRDFVEFAGVTGMPDLGPFHLAAKISEPSGKLSVEKLDLQVGTEELVELSLKGSIQDPLAQSGIGLSFTARGKDSSKMEKLFGRPVPVKGAFDASGQLRSPAPQIYQVISLKARLGESDLGGSVDLNLAGQRPKVVAVLSGQKLDLRPLLPKTEKKAPGPKKPAKSATRRDRVFSNEPLPLEALRKVDAQVKLQADQFLVPRLELKDLTADVRFKEGSLIAKKFQFSMNGGTINGHLSLLPEREGAAFALNLKVDQLDIGSLLKALEAKLILEGKIDAEIELNGRGRSVAEWMAGLNGRTLVVLGQGRLYKKYITILGADLEESLLGLINPFKKEEDYTAFNCFVNGLEIKDGIATCSALVLDTNQMNVVGGGEINLKDEKLNLSFQPSPKKGIGVRGVGKLSLSFGELAKPFKLGGTLAHPSLAIDLKKTLITVGTAVGGIALLGPAGLLAALAGASSGDKNPCLTAIERAKKRGKVSGEKKPDKKTQKRQ
jgi:uncharacterized protein involved in outer membrane biogenesis